MGLGELDDLEGEALLTSGLCRLFASAPLIDAGERDGLAGGVRHGFGETPDVGPIIGIGWWGGLRQ
jgi:hypothetical protein